MFNDTGRRGFGHQNMFPFYIIFLELPYENMWLVVFTTRHQRHGWEQSYTAAIKSVTEYLIIFIEKLIKSRYFWRKNIVNSCRLYFGALSPVLQVCTHTAVPISVQADKWCRTFVSGWGNGGGGSLWADISKCGAKHRHQLRKLYYLI